MTLFKKVNKPVFDAFAGEEAVSDIEKRRKVKSLVVLKLKDGSRKGPPNPVSLSI